MIVSFLARCSKNKAKIIQSINSLDFLRLLRDTRYGLTRCGVRSGPKSDAPQADNVEKRRKIWPDDLFHAHSPCASVLVTSQTMTSAEGCRHETSNAVCWAVFGSGARL